MVKINKQLQFFIIISSFIVLIDQLLKFLINNFRPDFSWNFFRIHFVTNTGAGFGILQGRTTILALISLIVAGIIIFNYNKLPKEKYTQILFAIFLGGVIGNLIDRIFRGFVIDFLEFSFWPAFNIADAAISIAVIGIIIKMWNK